MSSTLPLSHDQPAAPAAGPSLHGSHVLGHAIFMPQHGEPIHAYAARLRAMQHHLTMLIEAVERGMSHRPAQPRIDVRHPRLGPAPRLLSAQAPGLGASPSPKALAGRPAARPELDPPADRAEGEGGGDRAERRRDRLDRRLGRRDRRTGQRDRRRGLPDVRAVKVERRSGIADRRSGRRDRRLGHDRRYDARRTAQTASFNGPSVSVDPIAVFWGVNIVCWLGITAVAMIWGVG